MVPFVGIYVDTPAAGVQRTQFVLQHLERPLLLAYLQQLHGPLFVRRIASDLTNDLTDKRNTLVELLLNSDRQGAKMSNGPRAQTPSSKLG
eukprot:scaffold7871_cov26-Tisochrysis_lutea.AAC.1